MPRVRRIKFPVFRGVEIPDCILCMLYFLMYFYGMCRSDLRDEHESSVNRTIPQLLTCFLPREDLVHGPSCAASEVHRAWPMARESPVLIYLRVALKQSL